MNVRYIFLIFCLLGTTVIFAQQKERKLPPSVNKPSINLYAPYVSGDGNTLLYLSDYDDDGHHTMYWSVRKGRDWQEGKEINSLINRPTHNMRGGYALNFEGDRLYFTSRKSGIGGYDIWVSERSGSDWKAPKNLGAPLNTNTNEGAPTLTMDGNTMYYMECATMGEYKPATGCRIMVAKNVRGKWQQGEPLPANINTGNSQMPRIMGDELTLIFASDQFAGSDGLKFYMSRKEADEWSDPVPIDHLNGSGQGPFVSSTAKGRYVYRSVQGRRNRELAETLLPEKFRSQRVLRITGTYEGPVTARLRVFDTRTRKRLVNEHLLPNDQFKVVIREGSWYDMSIVANEAGYEYFSRVIDLDKVGRIDKESLTVELSQIQAGDTLSSSSEFIANKDTWNKSYDFELRRIAKFLKSNPSSFADLYVINPAYREDSVESELSPLLRQDSLYFPAHDSLRIWPDPIAREGRRIENWSTDSLRITVDSDTVYMPITDLKIDSVYHNDFSPAQEAALRLFMSDRGIDSTRYALHVTKVPCQDSELPLGNDENDKSPAAEKIVAILRE